MKVLLFTHHLEVGGSQMMAIELATAMRRMFGHEFVVFAGRGPLEPVLEQRQIRYIPTSYSWGWPKRQNMRELHAAIQSEKPDLIHIWDWWQYIDAIIPAYLSATPIMVTDTISERYSRPLPRHRMTTLSTPEFADLARRRGHTRVGTVVPAVDLERDNPNHVDGTAFRLEHGLTPDDFVLVTVSRLSRVLKEESLGRTIDAVRQLGRELPLKLVLVGDGDARERLEALAARTNEELGRQAVIFAGETLDPRPAYAAADAFIGMGTSAMRAMAYEKPVIVVGGDGFASALTPETGDYFAYYGIYGLGDGDPGNGRLVQLIREVATDRERAGAAGAYAGAFVRREFDVEKIASQLNAYYLAAAAVRAGLPTVAMDLLRSVPAWKVHRLVQRRLRRLFGSASR